jgi:FkbM family methyltransferase
MRLVHQIARRVRRQFGGTLSPEEAVRGELDRLGAAPRHTPLSSGIFGFRFDIVDGASFCACYDSIVRRGIYAFPSTTPAPYIIDCGANVGVSILAFKKSFPDARIVAFEPDPMVFAALRANVERAGWSSVEVMNKAVWCDESELEFWQEGSDAGRLERRADANPAQRIRVQTARLRDYLADSVDFLKLDIEGAEVDVLADCADRLSNVRHLFVEYHSFADEEQRLDTLLRILKEAAFRVFVQTESCPPKPFLSIQTYLGMDLQLNVYATRTSVGVTAAR